MFGTLKTSLYLLGSFAILGSSMAAQAGSYSVELSKTEIVRLPAAASAVIVGDTTIADVSIHSSNIIFVIGRSYGETNLIVLDEHGRTMMDADLQVTSTVSRSNIRVHNIGEGRETYRCVPYCLASPQLGDSPEFVNANTSTAQPISDNNIASGALSSPPVQTNFNIPSDAIFTPQ